MPHISSWIPLIAAIFAISAPVHASSTDYDGDWSVAITCAASSGRGPWGLTRTVSVSNGSQNFDIPLHGGRIAKATIRVSNRGVTIRGDSDISRGWWPSQWQLRLSGKLGADNRFGVKGSESVSGSIIRDCTATGSLFGPSPLSIAGKRQAVEASAKTTTPASSAAASQITSQPSAAEQRQPQSRAPARAATPLPSDGLSREQVRAVQQALQQLGLYDGALDGISGPRTRAGITQWQLSRGLEPTGQLTESQLKQIQQPVSAVVATTAPPAEKPAEQIAQQPAEPAADDAAGQRVLSEQELLQQKFTSQVGPVTATNLFIGDDGDILLFSNEDPEAPHFIRRVSGEGVFRENKMNVCAIGALRQIEQVFSKFATRELEELNPHIVIQNSPPWNTSCNALVNNSTDDVISIFRGDLIKDETLQEQIMTAFANKRLRWFNVIDRRPFDAMLEQQEQNGKIFRAQLRNGQLTGYGLLVSESGDSVVCAPQSEDAEFVKRAVADIDLGILRGKQPGANATIVREDLDEVFLRTKRGECGFVFGDGQTLSKLAAAFKRDGFSVDLIPVILPQAQGQAMKAQLQRERAEMAERLTALQAEQARLAELARQEEAQKQAEALRQAEQRRAALAQQARLEEVRRANEEAARREKLEQIRRIVASRARAIQDTLDQRIRQHLDSIAKEVSDTKLRAQLGQLLSAQEQRILDAENQRQRLSQEFPDWAADTLRQAKEEWTFGDISASLEDYGQARWRGRDIEAISVRVEFPMANAIIGERRTDCQVFTWINDEEFKFWRQTMSIECDYYDDLFEAWAIANEFNSQWKLPPN